MLDLALRQARFDDGPRQNDYVVFWRSRPFGRQKVGRIMLASESAWKREEIWGWSITVPFGPRGVPAYGNGSARSRDHAAASFRHAFERYEAETPDGVWTRGYEARPALRDRLVKMSWKTKFPDPIPLPGGGTIKTLTEARAYILTLSEREQASPKWQDAANYVLKAATEQRAWIQFARPALYKAIYGDDQELPKPSRVKKSETWREKRRTRKTGKQ